MSGVDIPEYISIHAAREGGDHTHYKLQYGIEQFQSTPPVKAATLFSSLSLLSIFISIHAAREGGDTQKRFWVPCTWISIHAAREGGDPLPQTSGSFFCNFNPRRP